MLFASLKISTASVLENQNQKQFIRVTPVQVTELAIISQRLHSQKGLPKDQLQTRKRFLLTKTSGLNGNVGY